MSGLVTSVCVEGRSGRVWVLGRADGGRAPIDSQTGAFTTIKETICYSEINFRHVVLNASVLIETILQIHIDDYS